MRKLKYIYMYQQTWLAAILSRALLTLESMASETFIWILISSPTVNAFFDFPWPEPDPEPDTDPGLFLEPDPGDLSPNAFLTLLAAAEVRERCRAGELGLWLVGESELDEEEEEGTKVRGLPEEVRQAATKIS